jgi:NAD(P)H-hydrate repair Nnr-like enzyme with NAD(P)H-hydrate dehydratase domain
VLAGLLGSMLAAAHARDPLEPDDALHVAGQAVALHSAAGVRAASTGVPVHATDLATAIGAEIADRRGYPGEPSPD